jgi:protease-4
MNRIAVVDVNGFIESEPGFWSLLAAATSVADVKQKLRLAADDGRVRAVVLRINSPGGEASASDMIYEEVRHFKEETRKPVVAALMGTAASGGYYVALSSDRIVANPTCITGSVGVVMDLLNIEGLYGKIGLQSVVIKSGDKKDIGSPTRKLTEEERAILQSVNRALFDRFLDTVRAGRPKMDDAQRAAISDGRIFTAQQALKLDLVDSVGYLSDAIAAARDLAGITHADVVLYRPSPSYNSNIYAKSGADLLFEGGLELLLRGQSPAFLYLWSPGS